jgi:phospholipid transport system substrate-binding protein
VTARRQLLKLVLCAGLVSVTPLAEAAPSAEGFVKSKQAELMRLVREGKPDAEVDKVFDQVLDYRLLAEAALRDHWADRTDGERVEFTGLLAKLVRASYRKNLKKTLGYEIQYRGTEQGKEGEVVRTVATSTKDVRQEPLTIDYVVRVQASGGQRIVDVVTEGSSMVNNYRSSFNRIMKKGGFPEVLKRMRKRAESGEATTE